MLTHWERNFPAHDIIATLVMVMHLVDIVTRSDVGTQFGS